jgi:hypothetical protein
MTTSILLGPTGAVSLLQRRLETGRAFGRDIEELFRQVSYDIVLEESADLRSEVVAALHTLRVAGQWGQRAQTPSRMVAQASEVAFQRLTRLLPLCSDHDPDLIEEVVEAWRSCGPGSRFLFMVVFLNFATPELLRRLRDALQREHVRAKMDVARLPDAPMIMTPGALAPVASPRDNALLLARLLGRLGDVQAALDLLEQEPTGDPRVLETAAAVLLDAKRGDEAMEQLRKALVKSRHGARIHERLLDYSIRNHDFDGVVEQVFLLLEESGELFYWHLLTDYVQQVAPSRVPEVRERLREQMLPKFVEVLMDEGDFAGVSEATSAKTFSYDQLWRLGQFLEAHAPAIAERLYERAILLQGSVAHSKVECASLGERIERTLPFFERIGKPTKPRRLFRDLLERPKNNIPLKREFDRLFGNKPATA